MPTLFEELGIRQPAPTRLSQPLTPGPFDFIERGLRIGQGETFAPVPFGESQTGIDFLANAALQDPYQDFLRGLAKGNRNSALKRLMGMPDTESYKTPQQALELPFAEREDMTLLDNLQEGAGQYAALLVGGGLAQEAVGIGGLATRFIDNIATGVIGDIQNNNPVGQGILWSIAGTGVFEGLSGALKLGARVPSLISEGASEVQKNMALRNMAKSGIDPRAIDTFNQIEDPLEVMARELGIEGPNVELKQRILEGENPLEEIQSLVHEITPEEPTITGRVAQQEPKEITKTLTTEMPPEERITYNKMIDEALGKIAPERPRGLNELDQISPTASVSERIGVLRGDEATFIDVMRRWNTPEQQIQKQIQRAANIPEDQRGAFLFDKMIESAHIHWLQAKEGRAANVVGVTVGVNGPTPYQQAIDALPTELRGHYLDLMENFNLGKYGPEIHDNVVKFFKKYEEFMGPIPESPSPNAAGLDEITEQIRNSYQAYNMPPRNGVYTAPSPTGRVMLQAQTMIAQGQATPMSMNLGLANFADLYSSIPVPRDPLEFAALRKHLLDTAENWYRSNDESALLAIRAVKNMERAKEVWLRAQERMSFGLGGENSMLRRFIQNRYSINGKPVNIRAGLSRFNFSSTHYPEANHLIEEMVGLSPTANTIKLKPAQEAYNVLGGAEALEYSIMHEMGHNLEKQLQEAAAHGDYEAGVILDALNDAVYEHPWRNWDIMYQSIMRFSHGNEAQKFLSKTAKKKVVPSDWLPAHGRPSSEIMADIIAMLSTSKGRSQLTPEVRRILEPVVGTIEETYVQPGPIFQQGPGRPPSGQGLGKAGKRSVGPFDNITEVFSDTPALQRDVVDEIKYGGMPQVGEEGSTSLRNRVMSHFEAALSEIRRIDGLEPSQLELFKQPQGNFFIKKPGKAVMQAVELRLGELGPQALSMVEESMITLPTRGSQREFVAKLLRSPSIEEAVKSGKLGAFGRAVREIRASSMLFGPSTWFANIASTYANSVLQPAIASAAGAVDAFRARRAGREQEVFVGEGAAALAGLLHGTNLMLQDQIISRLGRQARDPIAAGLQEVSGTLRNTREDIFRGSNVAHFAAKLGAKRGVASANKVIKAPFSFLRAQDDVLYNMNYVQQLYRRAYRELKKSGRKFSMKDVAKLAEEHASTAGRLHKEAADFAEAEMQKSFQQGFVPTDGSVAVPQKALQEELVKKQLMETLPQTLKDAKEAAEKTIFVARETGAWDRVLDKIQETDDLLGGIISIPLPFRRTPANIIREGVRTSPLGFLTAQGPLAPILGTVAETPEGVAELYGQAAVGTALFASLTALASLGIIEGNPTSYEPNRAKRTTYYADGRLPETMFINVGGRKISIPLQRLQPIGGLVVGAMETAEVAKNPGNPEELLTLPASAAWETVKALGTQDMLEGTADFLNAWASDDPGLQFAERFGGSFVPSAIRQGRQALGIPQARAIEGQGNITTGVSGFVSGVANIGQPKLGLFGEPIARTPVIGAIGATEVGGDPIVSKMIEVGAYHQAPDVFPELKASDQDSFVFRRAKGKLQKQFVTRVVNNPQFGNFDLDKQRRLIDAAFSKASAVANRRGRNALRRKVPITESAILTGKIR